MGNLWISVASLVGIHNVTYANSRSNLENEEGTVYSQGIFRSVLIRKIITSQTHFKKFIGHWWEYLILYFMISINFWKVKENKLESLQHRVLGFCCSLLFFVPLRNSVNVNVVVTLPRKAAQAVAHTYSVWVQPETLPHSNLAEILWDFSLDEI